MQRWIDLTHAPGVTLMMSAFSLVMRRSALAFSPLIFASAFSASAVAESDCRVIEGLPAAYAELAQTELHATPPIHPEARVPVDPTVAIHGQLMLGQSISYHLPVFMTDPWSHPHNFQVVLELALPADAQAAVAADQIAHPDSIYTVVPPVFSQTSLVIDVPGHPRKNEFAELDFFRNHFERSDRVRIVRAPARIVRILHFRELAPDLPKPAELAYVMFGSSGGLFLAHMLSAPPDFDQVLEVEVDGVPGDVDMTAGFSLSFADRSNQVEDRLKVGEEVSCATERGDSISLRMVAEPYCEIGELAHIVGKIAGNKFGTPTPCPGA
jgi:hypothetical protein